MVSEGETYLGLEYMQNLKIMLVGYLYLFWYNVVITSKIIQKQHQWALIFNKQQNTTFLAYDYTNYHFTRDHRSNLLLK